jgi:hypothetical protein
MAKEDSSLNSMRRKSLAILEKVGSGMKEGLGDFQEKLADMADSSPLKRMRSNSETEEAFGSSQSWNKTQRFSKWKNYSSIFDNLTKDIEINTKEAIVTLLMTYDTSRVLSVNKIDDE